MAINLWVCVLCLHVCGNTKPQFMCSMCNANVEYIRNTFVAINALLTTVIIKSAKSGLSLTQLVGD